MRGAWWADGVHFTCQPDCGRCCDEPGGIVYLSRNDAKRLAEHANLSVRDFEKGLYNDVGWSLHSTFKSIRWNLHLFG